MYVICLFIVLFIHGQDFLFKFALCCTSCSPCSTSFINSVEEEVVVWWGTGFSQVSLFLIQVQLTYTIILAFLFVFQDSYFFLLNPFFPSLSHLQGDQPYCIYLLLSKKQCFYKATLSILSRFLPGAGAAGGYYAPTVFSVLAFGVGHPESGFVCGSPKTATPLYCFSQCL